MGSGLLLECKVEVQERESDMKVRFEFPDGRVAVIEGDEIGRVEVIGTADDLTASVCPRKPPRWSVLSIKPWAPFGSEQPATPVEQPVSAAQQQREPMPTARTGESPSPPQTLAGGAAPQHELEPFDSREAA